MRSRISNTHSQSGSMLVTGLFALGMLIIPLLIIILSTGRLTTASVTANGLVSIEANAALNRSIDYSATERNAQVQLFSSSSTEAGTASNEVQEATNAAWEVSGVGSKAGWGQDVSLVFSTTKPPSKVPRLSGPGDVNSTPPAISLAMSIINLPGDTSSNYVAALNSPFTAIQSGGCSVDWTSSAPQSKKNPSGKKSFKQYKGMLTVTDVGSSSGAQPVCWVDQKMLNSDGSSVLEVNSDTGEVTNLRQSRGWAADDSGIRSWEHYSSGVETMLGFSISLPLAQNPIKMYYPGVASFGQPCDTRPHQDANFFGDETKCNQ